MIASGGRIHTLDATRGFAVMGILLMNIIGFSMPEAAYINPKAWGGTGVADMAAWAAAWILFDGKMRGLFSLLFGASMLLIIDKTEMSGGDGRRLMLFRLFWLFVIGSAHFLLLWWGDILMIYAVIGLIALLFVGKEPIQLVKWSFLAFAVHFLIVISVVASAYFYQHMAMSPGSPREMLEGFAQFVASLGEPGSQGIADEVALYRSGYAEIFAEARANFVHSEIMGLKYFGFDTLGFMLLGMAMLKSGFLTGGWAREQYRQTARHCFIIGLPPMIALAIWLALSDFDPLTTFGAFMAWSFPFRIPLTVGFAALILMLLGNAGQSAMIDRVAAAGRMALTNYLATTLVMTAIFYGWGLGLFGHVGRAATYMFIPPMWAAMLLWSQPWLNRFRYGPVEWLWRSLQRGKCQPMRMKKPV